MPRKQTGNPLREKNTTSFAKVPLARAKTFSASFLRLKSRDSASGNLRREVERRYIPFAELSPGSADSASLRDPAHFESSEIATIHSERKRVA
jgi:hypothetical protein